MSVNLVLCAIVSPTVIAQQRLHIRIYVVHLETLTSF